MCQSILSAVGLSARLYRYMIRSATAWNYTMQSTLCRLWHSVKSLLRILRSNGFGNVRATGCNRVQPDKPFRLLDASFRGHNTTEYNIRWRTSIAFKEEIREQTCFADPNGTRDHVHREVKNRKNLHYQSRCLFIIVKHDSQGFLQLQNSR